MKKQNGIMMMISIILTSKLMKNMNPINMAILILILSLLVTMMVFKSMLSSWVAFITILTFSSGMMTLFMYTASLSSNEKSKTKKSNLMILIMFLMMIMYPSNQSKMIKQSMKMFSSQNTIMIMGIILIITLIAISSNGHNPNQTLSTSF